MAERAHPDDPAFRGTIFGEKVEERYLRCNPFVVGRRVLDIPCGTGWGASLLTGATRLCGVDRDQAAIEFARRRYTGGEFIIGSMARLDFPAGSFDVVTCLEGLEHVHRSEAQAFLAEAWRVLSPGGRLLVTTPLRQANRHSLNPYHLYEYNEAELRWLLAQHFEVEDWELTTGGDGTEVWVVGRRRNEPIAEQPFPAADMVHQQALAWLRRHAGPEGASFGAGFGPSVLATCWHILSLEGLGQLATLPSEQRQAWVTLIQQGQRPDGTFPPPAEQDSSSSHDLEYLTLQRGYFCLQALDAVGERPLYPVSVPARVRELGPVAWLAELDWRNAWLESNRVMFVLAACVHQAEWQGDDQAAGLYHALLDALEERQDPVTGFWGTDAGASLLNGMAAAYHFLPFFRYVHRPLRGTVQMIDHTLALQQADGLFGSALGGGACEDMDAVDVLLCAAECQPAEQDRVKQALIRAFWAVWDAQLPDGAFPYSVGQPGVYRFSGLADFEVPLAQGDAWALWFRLSTLHHIKQAYPHDLPEMGAWTFRRVPALGYHRWAGDPLQPRWLQARLSVLPTPPAGAAVAAIIITNYNLSEYLPEAVMSALRQDVATKVLVVDDGSDEPLAGVLLPLLEPMGVRVIRVPRFGLPAARNHGVELVDTPYIACLDADDILRPEHMRRGIAALEADEAAVAAPGYVCFDGGHHTVLPTQLQAPGLLLENTIAVASVFRRSAWEAVGGYCTTMAGVQDWELWIAIAASGRRITRVDAVTFCYRLRGGSMYTRTKQPERFGQLVGTIMERHPVVFQEHWRYLLSRLFVLLQETNQRWAEQARLLQSQRAEREVMMRWRADGPALAAQLEELRQWVKQLEEAKTWLLGQNERQEKMLEEQRQQLATRGGDDELAQRMQQMRDEFETRWVEAAAHAQRMQQARDELEARYAELQAEVQVARTWSKALDEAKHWHLEQARAWREQYYRIDATPLWQLALQRAGSRVTSFRGVLGGAAQRALGLPQPPRVMEAIARFWRRQQERWKGVAKVRPARHVAARPWPKGQPLVSVVIPCYNYGRYIDDALDSVLSQTFRNLEVIVVDGGSTDGATRAKLQSLRRERTRVFLRETRHLVGSNRNYGIEQAYGRYICCLDADDRLQPPYLETALFLLERYQFDIVSTSIQQFGTADRKFDVEQRPTLEQMLDGNHVPTVAVFRKELWKQAGGIHDFGLGSEHIYEDWCFWVRLCGFGARVHNIVESPQFLYRVHSGASLSSQHGTVPSMDVQRARIREFNQDVLTADHRERFAANNRAHLINQAAFASLRDPRPAPSRAGTILITMPFLTVGGAEALMSAWCSYLAANRWRLLLVTTIPTGPELGDATPWFDGVVEGVYHLPRLLPETYWLDWYRYLITSRGVDILWQVGSPFTYEQLPMLKKEFDHLRVVDLLFNTGVHAAANRRQRDWIDRHVCENREVEAYLLERGAAPDTVHVVRSGVDLEYFAPRAVDASVRAALEADEATLVVGFLGRMSDEKGPDVFLEVADRFRDNSDIAFLMTGAGPRSAETMAKVQALRLERRFRHFGCVDDIRPYLGSCDILLLPSRFDGRPTVVLQAMAMGVPVVASRVGALPEMVQDGVTGLLCEPARAEAFVAALSALMADRELLQSMKRTARAYAQNELDHRTACRGIERVFFDLQDQPQPRDHSS